MKTKTSFLPLLKNEFTLNCFGWKTYQSLFFWLLYWTLATGVPFVLLHLCMGHMQALFTIGFLDIFAFFFFCLFAVSMANVAIPALGGIVSATGTVPNMEEGCGPFDFYFTRAVDRRTLFRARTTAAFVFLMTPFLIAAVLSIGSPAMVITSANPGWQHAYGANRSLYTHGPFLFIAWLGWWVTLVFFLLEWYGSGIAPYVKSNNWWTALYAAVPILLSLVGFKFQQWLPVQWISEQSFLLFVIHPVAMIGGLMVLALVVQNWCERRFSRLEIF